MSSGFRVGESTILVVGVEGVVDAMTADTITIGGITLPRLLQGPVKYLSVIWPEDDGCAREHCGDDCDPDAGYEAEQELERVMTLVERHHDEHHRGAFRTCLQHFCREVRG